MSLYDYETSKRLTALDAPFYALVMALMRQADSLNAMKLRMAWPEVWEELQARYNAPGGVIEGEQ